MKRNNIKPSRVRHINYYSMLLAALALSGCNNPTYQAADKQALPLSNHLSIETPANALSPPEKMPIIAWEGTAKLKVWGLEQHGRKTQHGQSYDIYSMSAAHRFLPVGTWVKVTHANGKQVLVQIQARLGAQEDVDMALSYFAAKQLGLTVKSQTQVSLHTHILEPHI